MGNSLALRCVSGGGAARRPLVIGPDGRPVCVEEAATGAAELMIEAPGHVVARAADAAKERRVRAMAADEPLRAGEVYLLVPAIRAGARLGDREVEAIGRLIVSGGGRKKGRSKQPGGKRIFPEVVVDMSAAEEDEMGTQVQAQAQAHCHRSTQWRPALDTIYEA
ncbi:uncharacterized protein LOC127760385 [Oryza glaberrima]|uniref:DUF4228 domain-containing protein n=2 Tax=Oryza TaxID=4527 RepID=A0A0D3EMK9_9ORYZ|nr:uncharacterized protein LOC127760385 [Oryza glaberrima]